MFLDIDGYDIIYITKSNYEDIWEVYDTNPKYFIATGGKVAEKTGILESIDQTPQGFDASNKHFFGIWQNGQPVAVVDLLLGYPRQDCLWIGLLLVHSDFHGKGAGSFIVKSIIQASEKAGFKEISLGVMEGNGSVVLFWEKMDFIHIRTSDDILVFSRSVVLE